MNATKIEPSICHYITANTLHEMSKPAAEAIDALFNSDLDVSFGDANRTLIDIPHFIQMLEDALDQQGIFYDENDIIHGGFIEIKDALDEVDRNVYIDLEN
jgi:hypothetical protein